MTTSPDLDKAGASQAHLDAEAARPYPTEAEKQYPLPPSTVDARSYTEIKEIFFKTWFPACPSGDLANKRDYVVWDRLGQSIVISRLDDGSVRAWHNVCQHRGARLVEKTGHCKTDRFVCPWHGFTYDLAGSLKFAPLRESFDQSLLDTLRMPPVRAEEWLGFVWLTLSDAAPPLKTYMGALWDELNFYGMDKFQCRFRFDLKLNANWKLVVDAFNETWHVPFTHKATLVGMMLWREARLRITPPHSWMTLPVQDFTSRLPADADHRLANVCHYLSFPNTIFSCFPTHLQTWNIWPVTPTETLFTAWGVVGPAPEGVSEESWSRRNERDWQHFVNVSAEDKDVINGWGSTAGSLGHRRYMFNTAESRLTAFHEEVRKRTQPAG